MIRGKRARPPFWVKNIKLLWMSNKAAYQRRSRAVRRKPHAVISSATRCSTGYNGGHPVGFFFFFFFCRKVQHWAKSMLDWCFQLCWVAREGDDAILDWCNLLHSAVLSQQGGGVLILLHVYDHGQDNNNNNSTLTQISRITGNYGAACGFLTLSSDAKCALAPSIKAQNPRLLATVNLPSVCVLMANHLFRYSCISSLFAFAAFRPRR